MRPRAACRPADRQRVAHKVPRTMLHLQQGQVRVQGYRQQACRVAGSGTRWAGHLGVCVCGGGGGPGGRGGGTRQAYVCTCVCVWGGGRGGGGTRQSHVGNKSTTLSQCQNSFTY